ncbi:MAG TPA: DUF87 domain-containing protein, partial [Chloroflexi bacterium]|nr:DUF87 domain-containing protein [Chloroflexota bacterium]
MKAQANPGEPIPNLEIGTIIEVDGTHVVAELHSSIKELTRVYAGVIYPIGQFGSIVKIHFGARLIFGYVGRLRMKSEYEREKGLVSQPGSTARVIEADLFGEGEWVHTDKDNEWTMLFERGVTTFPLPQQKVYLTPREELGFVYGRGTAPVLLLGEHVGSGGTPCYADMNALLGKHTAILGSTGSGKSGTVAAILHAILERDGDAGQDAWHPQIIILDPHNEYGQAFPSHVRLCTDEGSLKLPYWLLSLQELIGLLIGKAEHVATSQANIVKTALLLARQEGADAIEMDPEDINVDSPVPFLLDRLVHHIDSSTGKPSAASKQDSWNSVKHKLEVLRNDSRLGFMMTEWDGTSDPFAEVVMQFLGSCAPVRIVDLSGVPNEVAGAASSVIARTLFSVQLWQTSEERASHPLLLVCEEAHRYVPNRGEAQYEAAQEAIRRLAKEGRKYGIGLMLVSQRPSEVEATVLSQCNSWIVLRITNDSDRSHVNGILPDSLAGLTKVLSGLRRREAIFVGEAAALPSRILVRDLVRDNKPL